MKIILSLFVVVLLTGCQTASYTWNKPGVTSEQRQQDISEARKQAGELPPYSDPFSLAVVDTGGGNQDQFFKQRRRENQLADELNRERFFRASMEAKGYTYIPLSQTN
jgi:outer membrane biogenesis lipoprotein LolB